MYTRTALRVEIVLVIAALVASASPLAAQPGPRPILHGYPLDRVDRLVQALAARGLVATAGEFALLDMVKLTCDGNIPNTLANNSANPYLVPVLPVPQGSAPAVVKWQYRLRQDEAVILIGLTPPEVRFFSFQTWMGVRNGASLGVAVGDAVNVGTIHTIGSDPFNKPFLHVIAANRQTERKVRSAAAAAGLPDAIVNVETIAASIFTLGLTETSDSYYTAQRLAVPTDPDQVQKYVSNPPIRVFRVTPAQPLPDAPYSVPSLRKKGTGRTEMDLFPVMAQLNAAIPAAFPGWTAQPLDTRVWWEPERKAFLEKPYVALQFGYWPMGATRDTNYLQAGPDVTLHDDDFLIVYGVNHQKTGKATYSNFTVYAERERMFGITSVESTAMGEDAIRFLPPGTRNAEYFYAWEVAHKGMCHSSITQLPCLELEQTDQFDRCVSFPDKQPKPLHLNDTEIWIGFRTYMEPSTKVAPDDGELIYDRVIYFTHP